MICKINIMYLDYSMYKNNMNYLKNCNYTNKWKNKNKIFLN